MTSVLGIDPGPTWSAFALIDADTRAPMEVGKWRNPDLRSELQVGRLSDGVRFAGIEMVTSYGMPVGREVFETCVWIGRFMEVSTPVLVPWPRLDVKLHHCHSAKAKDSNIVQALIDRFAPGQRNWGKGTKSQPGWFHGFSADMWQAYALAVMVADRVTE